MTWGASVEAWIEVRTPNFVLISNAQARQARRAADRFEQFRNVLHETLPGLQFDPGYPLTIFAARDFDSFKALLPPELSKKGRLQPSGIFQRGSDKNFVVLRLDLPTEQGYHVIYHEYVHMIMRLNFRVLPLWLSEGFADFFGQATLSDTESGVGKPSPEQLRSLQQGRLLPLDVLMAVDYNSPYYREEEKGRLFYAQSWALTHYLMLGDNRAHTKQLTEYLRRVAANEPEPQAATRAFGDLKILQQQLDEYIRSMGFYYFKVATGLKAQEDQYPVRTLSSAEILAARGELMIYTGRPEEAKLALEQALQLDPRCLTAHESLGMLSLRQKDRAQAARHFAAAADLDSGNFTVLYNAARYSFEIGGVEELARAEGYLRKAVKVNPRYVPALEMLSQILASQETARAEALDLAKKAAEIEPEMITHQIQVGRILLAMGKIDEAIGLGQRLLAAARSDNEKQLVESFFRTAQSHQRLMLEAKQRQEARARGAVPPPGTNKEPNAQSQVVAQPAGTGPAVKIAGVIQTVKCGSPATMDVVLDAGGKQIRLRAQNHYQVQYWAVDSAGRDNFQPCKELQGKKVQVEYSPASGLEFAGWIHEIWIEK
jgi:tetratricopeptide (TPR) repeat protein